MIPWFVPNVSVKNVSVKGGVGMQDSRKVGFYFLFGALTMVTCFAYFPTLNFGFVFDDAPTIVDNFYMKLHSYSEILFSHSRWVSTMLNSFTYHNWGLRSYPFRLFNLGLHICNALLVFLIFRTLLMGLKRSTFVRERANWISILASGLFLLHPVQTQTATYITQMRLEGLATFFILSIIGLFILSTRVRSFVPKICFYAAAAFMAVCSAGTKEIVVVLPILLLLIDSFFIAQGRWREMVSRIPFYLVIIVALWTAFYSFSFSSTVPFSVSSVLKLDAVIDNNRGNLLTESPKEKISAIKYLISEFRVLLHYFWIYFWPTGLSFDYDYRLVKGFWQIDVLAPLLALSSIFITSVVLWIRDRSSIVSFAILWFFVSVGPRASIVPSAEMACDYKTYLGSVGMMLLLAYLMICLVSWMTQVVRSWGWRWSEKTYRVVLMLFVLVTSYQGTVARNDVWSTPLKFWGDVIRKSPNKSRAYNNYAVALAESGATDEALEYYKKSCDCDPYYAEPLINLGSHYQIKNDYKTALHYYGKALNLTHEPHPECYNNTGLIQYHYKNYDKAKSCFKTAIALKGHYGKAHYNLARVYYDQGDVIGAYEESGAAIRGDFAMPHVYLLHGKCAVSLSKFREGQRALETALRSGHDFEGTFMLGSAYYNERVYKKACEYFGKAYRQRPDNLACAYNYAQALMNDERYSEAIPLFEQSASDVTRFPFAQLHVSKCLSRNGNRSAALSRLEKLTLAAVSEPVKRDAHTLKMEILREVRAA